MPKCNCKKDKCLSPAVLQINNYDCPTVFHKVTFPAAVQSTIGGWSDVTNGFGGTNTTVLFDL